MNITALLVTPLACWFVGLGARVSPADDTVEAWTLNPVGRFYIGRLDRRVPHENLLLGERYVGLQLRWR